MYQPRYRSTSEKNQQKVCSFVEERRCFCPSSMRLLQFWQTGRETPLGRIWSVLFFLDVFVFFFQQINVSSNLPDVFVQWNLADSQHRGSEATKCPSQTRLKMAITFTSGERDFGFQTTWNWPTLTNTSVSMWICQESGSQESLHLRRAFYITNIPQIKWHWRYKGNVSMLTGSQLLTDSIQTLRKETHWTRRADLLQSVH